MNSVAGIWFALKEYLIEGLIYDHDVGISVLVFEVLGYVERVVEGQPPRGDHLTDDYDDYEDDEDLNLDEGIGEEELIIFQRDVCFGNVF